MCEVYVITPDFIERSKRKTLSLSVLKDGSVVVKAPISMRDETINRFVEEKQNWIKDKLFIVNKTKVKFDDIVHYQKYISGILPYKCSCIIKSFCFMETNIHWFFQTWRKLKQMIIFKLLCRKKLKGKKF